MSQETIQLAEYAANLRFEELPADVIQRAKDCIIDTAAAIIYGNTIPWSRTIVGYAQRTGPGGKSRILGAGGPAVQPALAALANGTLSHAFELDNVVINPGAGVHGGATLLPPGLAMAQEAGGSGRDLIAAVVAGAEVMIRIGWATKHSNEAHGFHAPGTTGPFGAAIAAGRFLKLDAPAMTNALGIAGSLCGGLMEFARSGTGAMVKRLHIGRACEAGVLAASLAHGGFTGPSSVLEGEAGFLRVFCSDFDLGALTRGLGHDYATLNICLKRYACHITAQRAVQAVQELRAEHGIGGDDVKAVTVMGEKRMSVVNNIPEPTDVMMSQYSRRFASRSRSTAIRAIPLRSASMRSPTPPSARCAGASRCCRSRGIGVMATCPAPSPSPPMTGASSPAGSRPSWERRRGRSTGRRCARSS